MPGIYIHIPFCIQKCLYCDFYSEAGLDVSIPDYLKSLRREIQIRAHDYIGHDPFDTIYFGGGTPSLLTGNQISIILHFIKDSFPITENAEVSIETNPGTLSEKKLEAYLQAGLIRLSIGAQSFLPEELELLGRNHTQQDIYSAVQLARAVGFENIGLDLIFGLPNQVLYDWQVSIRRVRELEPEHISAYVLTLDESTSLGSKVRNGELPEPDEELVSDMYLWTSETLTTAGYEHYEISNFAKPGLRSRHNRGYWSGEPYLGFGPSAHSFDHNKRSWNVRSIDEYSTILSAGKLPVLDQEELTFEQQKMERIALLLRTDAGIPIEELEVNQLKLERYFRKGLAVIRDRRFVLTTKGFLLADEIAVGLTT